MGHGVRRPVSLSSVLEPIADLSQGQTSLLRQVPLLVGCGVSVLLVAVFESLTGLLLEAVNRLLSVPDGLG